MTTFPEWLLSELEKRGMSQADLARKSHITPAQISRIISGSRGAETKTLVSIATALKIPPEEILSAAGTLPPEPPKDETLYRIEHLYHTLKESSSKTRALEFLEFLSQQEEKSDRKGKKSKSLQP